MERLPSTAPGIIIRDFPGKNDCKLDFSKKEKRDLEDIRGREGKI